MFGGLFSITGAILKWAVQKAVDVTKKVIQKGKEVVVKVMDTIDRYWQKAIDFFKKAYDKIVETLNAIYDKVIETIEGVVSYVERVSGKVKSVMHFYSYNRQTKKWQKRAVTKEVLEEELPVAIRKRLEVERGKADITREMEKQIRELKEISENEVPSKFRRRDELQSSLS